MSNLATLAMAVSLSLISPGLMSAQPTHAQFFASADSVVQRRSGESQRLAGVRDRLLAVFSRFKDAAVEDGYIHPAEQLAVSAAQDILSTDSTDVVLRASSSASDVADLIRLLGRSDALDHEFRSRLVRDALRSPSVLVRDAVLQSVELWRDKALADRLDSHEDSVAWLQEYAVAVRDGLRG